MFDLFKKEEINSLKARIIELEEENQILHVQFEKKDERTKKSTSAKQEVERELNEARQKISSLTNELEKQKKEASGELNYRFSDRLSGQKIDEILFFIDSVQSKNPTLITVYLAGNESLKDISSDTVKLIDSSAIFLIDKIESTTGKVIFYDANQLIRLVFIPLSPISHSETAVSRQFNTVPLRENMEFEKILVINAHAGETFIGVIEAGNFTEHDIIRSSVMGKHAKGGWSQKRFQSLVEEDVKHHADKVRTALAPMIEKNRDIQWVIAGGEGKLVKMILEGYDYPLIMKSMDMFSNREQMLRDVMSLRLYGI